MLTISADITVRGAGFGGLIVETGGVGDGKGITEVFFLSASETSVCASLTGDCASVSLGFTVTASLQVGKNTHS